MTYPIPGRITPPTPPNRNGRFYESSFQQVQPVGSPVPKHVRPRIQNKLKSSHSWPKQLDKALKYKSNPSRSLRNFGTPHKYTTPFEEREYINPHDLYLKQLVVMEQAQGRILTGYDAIERQKALKKRPQEVCLCVVGFKSSGKSELIKSFLKVHNLQGDFKQDCPDDDVDIHDFDVAIDNKCYNFYIKEVNTPGQLNPEQLTSHLHRPVDAFLVCYEVFSRPTFLKLENSWIDLLKHEYPDVPFILVGTKADSRPNYFVGRKLSTPVFEVEERKFQPFEFVSRPEAQQLAKSVGAQKYVECAASAGNSGTNGVNAVFEAAVKVVKEEKDICDTLCTIL